MDFKKSFSKGITKINVKTSNFMEENKLRTQILTLEGEIAKIKVELLVRVKKDVDEFFDKYLEKDEYLSFKKYLEMDDGNKV